MSGDDSIVLVAACDDVPGIVRAVSNFVYDLGAGITDSSLFSEEDTQKFFFRIAFRGVANELGALSEIEAKFMTIAEQFGMNWRMYDMNARPKVLLAVSKFGHCLNALLFRWRNGDLPADIVGVVSNHEDFRDVVEWYGLAFHHLPISKETKQQQEGKIQAIMQEQSVDLLVLARYMQILSTQMCEYVAGKAINIHHSFLPGFKGAKPYHQAYARGVKLIGATAHYVTPDLDEGPIIEQDVQRVAHSHRSKDMVRLGQDIESRVLERAVRLHCEHRILLSGHRTVIFD